jgi:hypothetical protein
MNSLLALAFAIILVAFPFFVAIFYSWKSNYKKIKKGN